MKIKRPHTVAFVALSGFLLAPLALRIRATHLEPYPAVLLPSGALKLKIENGTTSIVILEVGGQSVDTGTYRRIAPTEFLKPIPVQYLFFVSRRNFGVQPRQTAAPDDPLSPAALSNEIVNALPTDDDRTRKWLRQRLREAKCEDDHLVLRWVRRSIQVGTRKVLEENVADERVIRLD